MRLGLRFINDVGVESARLIVEERKRRGPYSTAGDLVRRTGLKPQAVLSLTMAGAFDAIAPNRREALWEAGLHPRPSRNGQAALPMSSEEGVPRLPDFTEREKMMGEYRVMGIYPRGHLMEFVRPGLGSNVLTTRDVERRGDDELVKVTGWPVARQHPRGRDGTVFVTIEDETGDVQVIVWHDLFARRRRELSSHVVEVTGASVEMGRDHERHSDGSSSRRVGHRHAAIPRLALREAARDGHCTSGLEWFIIKGKCAVDIA